MTSAEPHGFRRWRRTRPFWGGVFAILGGIELIAIPMAPMPLTIHQGMAGIASWLIGALLIVAGALLWFQPAQRSFYGILAVLLSLASFLTSNFGGFLLGMLLGLIGGTMGFAWSPMARRTPPEPPQNAEPDYLIEPKPAVHADPLPTRTGPRHGKMMAFAAPAILPIALGAHFFSPSPTPTPSSPTAPVTSPTPAPSTSTTPGPDATPTPGTSATPGATDDAAKAKECPELPADTSGLSQAQAGMLLNELKDAKNPQSCLKDVKTKSAGSGFHAYTDLSTLRASSLTMSGLSYDGVAELDTPSGTVRALKFSMSKAVLKNVDQTTGHGGASNSLKTGNLTLNDGVTMYTTKMSSKLIGIPLTFTPDSPPPLVLPYMIMTDVVSEQAAVDAGGAQISGLTVNA
ncbi:hypothetical protein J4573_14310 [Actinomadura barringtoniae]|uniref:Uncharacterized protein n=1 Tax=Actinomadura barringtoniae TaxID=1427535 RepID=A0A939PEL3_9ACTN|nr:DUF6114 domain-containing protein [Actinomadura barringtoniae]MBO2448274.1 hypothetical protein [Actinomadura barringtoniae]